MKIGLLLLGPGEPANRSPVVSQCKRQARMLEGELRRRRHDVTAFLGPIGSKAKVAECVRAARAANVERIGVVPLFPICEQTTTMMALDAVEQALADLEWQPPCREVTDWHRHPDYYRIRADGIREHAFAENVELHAPDTALLFAAGGAAKKHLRKGPKYVAYVEEVCRGIARELGRSDYTIGYRRPAKAEGSWTEPEIDQVLEKVSASRLLVVPVTEMQEQVATLKALDKSFRKAVEKRGLTYHREPIPFESPRFANMLADVVEDLLRPEPIMGDLNLRRCLCRGTTRAFCLNAAS